MTMRLRHDPMFGIALGKLGAMEQTPQVLAGKAPESVRTSDAH